MTDSVSQQQGGADHAAVSLGDVVRLSREPAAREDRVCFRTGEAVSVPDLNAGTARWPQFAPVAVTAGFLAVHAVPMRLGDTVLGALGLFGSRTGALSSADLRMAQALAHVASVALVSGRAAQDKTLLTEQLQTALHSRVLIEQAKGIMAQLGVDTDQAFTALRRYSRDHNQPLTQIAQAIVTRALAAPVVLTDARTKGITGRPPGTLI